MTAALNPVLARFSGEPSLVEPSLRDRFEADLVALVTHADFAKLPEVASSEGFWGEPGSFKAQLRPYDVVGGILQIPVKGVLLHDFPYAFFGLATGYDYIWRAFERGMGDAGVRGVALVIDSPGGMVAGCFDAVDKMVALKDAAKPVRAFAHEMAYSAAYAIAGGVADHIAVSRTGGVGSIGVVTMHMDVSAAMEQRGIKITFIHAGKHKVDGNAYEPLPDDVKARIQSRIDEMYGVFVSCVARGRGMEEQAVRDTEALTFTATQAVSNGLADSIGSLDDAVAAFAAFLDDPSDNNGEDEMATEANQSAVDQAALDAARAEGRTEAEAATATAVADARTAERDLVFAIIDSPEGKKRPAAARAIAAEGGRTLEQATAFLAKLPEEKAEQVPGGKAAPTGFEAAMSNGNPEVGAEGSGSEEGDETALTDPKALRALAAAAGLKGFATQQ